VKCARRTQRSVQADKVTRRPRYYTGARPDPVVVVVARAFCNFCHGHLSLELSGWTSSIMVFNIVCAVPSVRPFVLHDNATTCCRCVCVCDVYLLRSQWRHAGITGRARIVGWSLVCSHALPFTRIPLPRYNIIQYRYIVYTWCWLRSGRGPGDRLQYGVGIIQIILPRRVGLRAAKIQRCR